MKSKNKLILVVLAAGMGSRYGGLKQMDTFSHQGDTIIDFSLYDALQVGFKKIVFIIRRSFEKEFKEIFNKRLGTKVEIVYVYQELDSIPKSYINSKRKKPWGTGHAVLIAKNFIDENFVVINADDFYGKEAFRMMIETLKNTDKNSCEFSMIGYLLRNTVSQYGFVSRGECTLDEKGVYLSRIVERKKIGLSKGELKRENEEGRLISMDENTIISMNFWGFTPRIFDFIEKLFRQFLVENSTDLEAEFFLPFVVNEILKFREGSVRVLTSKFNWFGVTYPQDKIAVRKKILELKEKNEYPIHFWKN